MFFFEKKNQKTFVHWPELFKRTSPKRQSLFASFSSEKEESFLPSLGR
jgi:hypothetical protein